MLQILTVGVGGFLGSISRYLLGGWIWKVSGNHWFPLGTLSVNVLGSLLIGFLAGILEHRGNQELSYLFLIVGFLGGFTTFSSFSQETIALFRSSQAPAAFLNIFFQVNVCLLAAWIGHSLSTLIKI